MRDSSARVLKVSKSYVAKKKRRLRKSSNPPSDCGSNADEFPFEWSNFLNCCAYFLEEFGED